MCGRYALYSIESIPERFRLEAIHEKELSAIKPRYNIGPSQNEPVIIEHEGRRIHRVMQWGYMPHWAKDKKAVFKYKTFNARSEDAFNKPTWKNAIRYRRCLIPSNGFYEWKNTSTGKQPYFIRLADEPLFAFAGVYGYWKGEDGAERGSYSILTTEPNEEMKEIHTRMPVILHERDEDQWLDQTNDETGAISKLLCPYDSGALDVQAVSRDVNAMRVDEEYLIKPINPL